MLLLNAVFKKKVRLSGPLVRPSLMTSLQEKQRFFFTGPWRGPGPGAVAPATPPLGGPVSAQFLLCQLITAGQTYYR